MNEREIKRKYQQYNTYVTNDKPVTLINHTL